MLLEISLIQSFHYTVNQGEIRRQQAMAAQTEHHQQGIYVLYISYDHAVLFSLFTVVFYLICSTAGVGKKKDKKSEC